QGLGFGRAEDRRRRRRDQVTLVRPNGASRPVRTVGELRGPGSILLFTEKIGLAPAFSPPASQCRLETWCTPQGAAPPRLCRRQAFVQRHRTHLQDARPAAEDRLHARDRVTVPPGLVRARTV